MSQMPDADRGRHGIPWTDEEPPLPPLCEQGGIRLVDPAALWEGIRAEAEAAARADAALAPLLAAAVLRRADLAEGLAHCLGRKLGCQEVSAGLLADLCRDAFAAAPALLRGTALDLAAVRERDPACPDLLTPLLFFKGFLALQTHRLAHYLWQDGRRHLAHHVNARSSEVFAVDIHPAARLGCGILLDHGTGLVIGETAVVENDVSLLQGVTLGGTGKEGGDRHPKVRRGVLIGAGAKVLGNIEIGEGAKIGAGSIVLTAVAPHTTVVGVPARPVGGRLATLPALTMDQSLPPPEYAI
jgi:serine O-acetyltransferase